ncbi:MAG TPA: hypothetical protein VMB05_00810, partial [Solirubrobacteraceae bacterium]|nr:hypothetical protein [Solirubrobacteraceae bacterium]
ATASGVPGLKGTILPGARRDPRLAEVGTAEAVSRPRDTSMGSRPAASSRVDSVKGVGEPLPADRLAALRDQHDSAQANGNVRRAARLEHRITHRRSEAEGRPEASAARQAEHEREARYRSFLDAQARLPAEGRGEASMAGTRSYASLAGIAGYGRREYLQLDRESKHQARRLIDRELASRREAMLPGSNAHATVRGSGPAAAANRPRQLPSAESHSSEEADSLIPERFVPPRGGARPDRAGPSESIVMKDALEITARRRRQLGGGR